MDGSPALEARIEKEAAKLERFADRIMACHVTVELPHRHQQQGKQYTARVDVTIPGAELVAGHSHGDRNQYEDPYVAVRDAFRAVTRQLEDKLRKNRGKVKHHELVATGKIKELFPQLDYGVIETVDGREVYFHRNSIVDAEFDRLLEQSEVRFAEEAGAEGPQASTVHLIGKHHPT